MKLAVLLYGLFRHRCAIKSWPNIFSSSVPYDAFIFATHTLMPNTARSRDGHIDVDALSLGIRGPSIVAWSILDQDAFDVANNVTRRSAQLKYRRAPETTKQNCVRVLFQLRELVALFTSHDAKCKSCYTHILCTRVDVIFTRPVTVKDIYSRVYLPNFAHFRGYNDRLIAGPKEVLLPILLRYKILRTFSKTHAYTPEAFLKWSVLRVVNASEIRFGPVAMRRVRTTGLVHPAQYPNRTEAVDRLSAPTAPALVTGIITSPSHHRVRTAARQTWMADQSDQHVAQFVIGRRFQFHPRLQEEMQTYGDFAVVESPDGNKGDSAEKVHRWFQYALLKWPFTSWIAKMEDDGILWPSALIKDLRGLTISSYYGVMRWVGACQGAIDKQCYGDSFARKPVPSCQVRDGARCNASKRCCEPACPGQVRFAPFACGPLDVRHRAFAQRISACAPADAYFRAIRRTGGGTTDGAQGAAFRNCVGAVHIADATDSRLAMGVCDSCSRCAKGQIVVHHTHFLKSGDAHTWNASWRSLTRRQYTPTPLPEYTVTFESAPVRISRPRHIVFGSGSHPYDPMWMQPACAANRTTAQRKGRRLKMKLYAGCSS